MDILTEARNILRNIDIPWLELDLMIDIDAWKTESKFAESFYQEYRESYGTGWESCCLHGLETHKTYTADNYGYDEFTAPYKYTELSNLTPTITNFWKNIFPAERYTRIRFMKLTPQGKINWHNDGSIPEYIDPVDSILPINIAVVHPNNCDMHIKDNGIVPWTEGKIMMINISKPHAFYNHSDENRIHMIANIILGKKKLEFCEMLVRSYKKYYA